MSSMEQPKAQIFVDAAVFDVELMRQETWHGIEGFPMICGFAEFGRKVPS